MDGTAVHEIRALAERGIVVMVDGQSYSPVKMVPVYHDPRPKPLRLRTLEGLVRYVEDNPDGMVSENAMIVIEGPRRVVLVTEVYGPSNDRTVIAEVDADACDPFPFDKFLGLEEFQVALRSRVIDTDERRRLAEYISRIDVEDATSIDDDGVSQRMTVKRGVSGAVKGTEPAPSIVRLKPYRAFNEIEQPESEFIFRISSAAGVKIGLFEADGGAWTAVARERISIWLSEAINSPQRNIADKPGIIA